MTVWYDKLTLNSNMVMSTSEILVDLLSLPLQTGLSNEVSRQQDYVTYFSRAIDSFRLSFDFFS